MKKVVDVGGQIGYLEVFDYGDKEKYVLDVPMVTRQFTWVSKKGSEKKSRMSAALEKLRTLYRAKDSWNETAL